MRPLHLPNVRVHSHVFFVQKEFWASKAMYRGCGGRLFGSAGVLCKPGIPPQSHRKGDCTHLVDFLRLSSMYMFVLFGGCSSRGLGGLLSKTAVSGATSGSRVVRTCCCSHCCCSQCCMAGDLARARPSTTLENILTREISNLSRTIVCSVYHVLRKCTPGDRAVYLYRADPEAMDHRGV